MTNRDRFVDLLATEFARPEFALGGRRYGTARAFAEAYVIGLCDGTANKDGVAVQAVRRALGIKANTYKALREFICSEGAAS